MGTVTNEDVVTNGGEFVGQLLHPAVDGPENGGVPRLQAFRPRCRCVHEDHGYQVFSVIAPKRVPTP